jgi:hypothetical protein
MPETSGELPSAEDVQAGTAALQENTQQAKATRLGVRIALGGIFFSIVSSTFVWVHSARVAESAREAAIVEAARAREESDEGLCSLIGLLIAGDTPQRAPVLREALRKAYEAPHCVPPLLPDGRHPLATPSPSPG